MAASGRQMGAVFAYDADGNIVVLHVAPRGDVYLMSVDTVEKEDRVRIVEESGRRFAVVPLELWEDVVDKAEMLDDIEAYDRAKKALESGETELVPSELVDRLCAGENPVKVWREYRGLSQRELAGKAGVAQAYVAQIETGRRKGSVDTLRRLAEALRVDLDDLVP